MNNHCNASRSRPRPAPKCIGPVAGLLLLGAAAPAQKFQYDYGKPVVAEVGTAVLQAKGGGYVIAGTTGTNAVGLGIDPDGTKVMDALHAPVLGGITLTPHCGRQTADGGFIASGEVVGNGPGLEVFLARYDKAGNLLWPGRFLTYRGDATGVRQGTRVVETIGGGFAVTTNVDADGALQGALFATDKFGGLMWWKKYTYNRLPIRFHDLRQGADGTFTVVGTLHEPTRPGRLTLIVRTTPLGAPIWSFLYGENEDVEQQAITATKDGMFVVWGHYAPAAAGSFLLKLANDGAPMWRTQFPSIQGTRPTIAEAPNGDLLCNGRFGHDALVLRTNKNGVKQIARTYGAAAPRIDEIYQVVVTEDGGFAATGSTQLIDGITSDIYLLKGNAALHTGLSCPDPEFLVVQSFVPTQPVWKQLQAADDRQMRYVYVRVPGPCTDPNELCFEPDCVHAPRQLTLWLPLDEVTGASAANRVQQWNGFSWTGAHQNGPTPAPGKVAGALSFDGVDDKVVVPHHGGINVGTGDFTIDAWIRMPTALRMGVSTLVDKRVSSGSQYRGYSLFLYRTTAGVQLGLQLADGTFANYLSPVLPIVVGQWHLVAARVARGTTSHLVLDNASFPFAAGHNLSLANTAMLHVGASSLGGSHFAGEIDELEIFRRALTLGELRILWRASYAGKCKEGYRRPHDLALAQGATDVTARGWITNGTDTPLTYTGWFQGLASGPGCNIQGPTLFLPSDPITIGPIAPGATQPFTASISRPSGMNAANQAGSYRLMVQSTSGDTFTGYGVVHDRRDIAVTGAGWDGAPRELRVGARVALGPARLTNTTGAPIALNYRIVAMNDDLLLDDSVLSLDGLAPGNHPTGSVVIPASGFVELDVSAQFVGYDALGTYTVQIEADVDNDGVPDFLGGRLLTCSMSDGLPPIYTGVAAPTTVGTPTLQTSGPALVGGSFEVIAEGLVPNGAAFLALSLALANPPFPLALLGGQPTSMLYLDPSTLLTFGPGVDGDGRAVLRLSVPADSALAGVVLHWQVFDFDPALGFPLPLGNSNAMSVTIE